MAGTKLGGQRAAQTNKERYGQDFYKVQGSKGGSVKGVKKGFALDKERARRAGTLGGTISRRGSNKKIQADAERQKQEQEIDETLAQIEKDRPLAGFYEQDIASLEIPHKTGFFQSVVRKIRGE